MEIIRATEEHVGAVYDLVSELQSEKMEEELFAQMYSRNLADKDIIYLLAMEGESIVGFASLHIQYLLHHCARIGEIQEIVVTESRRGTGVGATLLEATRNCARQNDCTQMEVCCNRTRERSHRFYLRYGMKQSHYKFVRTI